MFCPNCGLKETQDTQYCRSCGGDLNVVRTAIASPESASDSAAARNEIGRAFAKKIEGLNSAKELKKITNDVLPEIEKFLESPPEKRLRRIRRGSIISCVGLGAAVGFTFAGLIADNELFFFAALGFVTFFIGIAFLINGFFFSLPKRLKVQDEESTEIPDSLRFGRRDTKDLLMPPSARSEISSVTENTTRTLDDKLPVRDISNSD